MRINKKVLMEYGLPDEGCDGVELIEDNIDGHSRWSVHHEIVFKWVDGKYYRACYSVGATEMQDECPWEYDDEINCTEVKPTQVTKTVFVEVV